MGNSNSPGQTIAIEPTGEPVIFSPGPYYDRGKTPFVVEIDAKPLAVLFNEVLRSLRVYEFMTITRPGDIYHYLRLRLVDVDESVTCRFQRVKPQWFEPTWDKGYLPLIRFDGLFRDDGDDTELDAQCWLSFRSGNYWKTTTAKLLAWVKAKQQEVRSKGDWLTLREIGRIDAGSHWRDYEPDIQRRCTVIAAAEHENYHLPDAVMKLIEELMTRENVQSVSMLARDPRVWRRLIQEQLVRSDRTGYAPTEAFALTGSAGACPWDDWGGKVGFMFEGIRCADLMVGAFKTWPELDKEGGSLTDILTAGDEFPEGGRICHYVLLPKDLGPLNCAQRTVVDDRWVLYESNRPYVPNNWGKPHLKQKKSSDG